MKKIILLSILSVSLRTAFAFDGADGLPALRSAKVLEDSFTWYAPATMSRYDAFGTVVDLEPGFRTAATEDLEVGFSAPYRLDRASDTEGLRFLRGMVKYQLHADQTQYSAVTLHGSFDTAGEQAGIGSGSSNLGVEFNFSDYSVDGSLALHSMLALERSDNLVLLDDGSREYQLVNKLQFGLGFEQRLWRTGSFFLQGRTTLGFGDTAQRQYGVQVMPGFRFGSPNGGLALTLAAGQDIPQRGEQPERQYLLALSYSPREPRLTLKRLAGQVDVLAQRVTNLEQQLAQHKAQSDARFTLAEGAIAGLDAATTTNADAIAALKIKTGTLTVEVVNASGQLGIEQVFIEKLKAKGYIVHARFATDMVLEASRINYREGYAEQAVALGHELRKWQVVAQGSHLPPGMDLRLFIGRDMK